MPFYDQICEATGLRNILQPDVVANTQVDATRTVRIEFDSNVRNLPWTFKPVEPIADVHPGQVQQIVYSSNEQYQPRDHRSGHSELRSAVRGPVFPEARMLLLCQADDAARRDAADAGGIRDRSQVPDDLKTITLSYTFFEVEGTDAGNLGNADDRQAPVRPRA